MPSPMRDAPRVGVLAGLPVHPSGLVVPYATLCVPDDGSDPVTTVRTELGHELRCACVYGQGKPRFGRPCIDRQRQCMRQGRCSVCGHRVRPAKGGMLFLGVGVTTVPPGVEVPASIEPPVHPVCAAYSTLVCPRVIEDNAEIVVAAAASYEVRKFVTFPVLPTGPRMLALHEPVPYSGVAQEYAAVLPRHGVSKTPLHDWMTHRAPQPYRRLYIDRM